MMKVKNETHFEGYLYEHSLDKKVTGEQSKNPGTEYITGTISVATDDDILNIVPIHFTYVTPLTSTGKPNSTFTALSNIIDGTWASVMGEGKDKAVKLRIDSAIGLNEFYTDRNGKEELVSAKRNEGGFVHLATDGIATEERDRNLFRCDILITNVRHIDADDEKNLPDKAIIKGAIFNFRGELLPVEFTAVNPGAINYFEDLDASNANPVFTQIWGRQISETIVRTITEESAFGDALVREVKSSRKDWVITGARPEPYLWDDESTLTAMEVNDAIKNRELTLATIKKRQDDYKASKGNAIKPTISTPVNGDFKF